MFVRAQVAPLGGICGGEYYSQLLQRLAAQPQFPTSDHFLRCNGRWWLALLRGLVPSLYQLPMCSGDTAVCASRSANSLLSVVDCHTTSTP